MTTLEQAYWRGFWKTAMTMGGGGSPRQRQQPRPLQSPTPMPNSRPTSMPTKIPGMSARPSMSSNPLAASFNSAAPMMRANTAMQEVAAMYGLPQNKVQQLIRSNGGQLNYGGRLG